MIGRIVIENYKSIENLTLDLGRVTVLIGANGSGKSNILEAIALCSAAAANKLDNEFLFSRGVRVAEDPRHMRSAFSSEAKETINLSVADVMENGREILVHFYIYHLHEGKYEWDATLYRKRRRKKNQRHIYEDATKHLFGKEASRIVMDGFRKNQSKLQTLKVFYAHKIKPDVADLIYDFLMPVVKRDVLNAGRFGDFVLFGPENSALRRFEEEGQIQPLGVRGEGLFKLLTVLARETEPEEGHDKTRLAEIQERLQLLDWFGDFQIGGNVALGERTLKIRDQYLDGDLAYFTQRSANEGFLFLLFYFTLFVAKETPRFFAIDNIDASLNPKLCAELLRQLTELAEKYDKQVILTTHNPAVLDGLNLRDDNQRLYVVERDLDGRTGARRIPAPRPPEENEETVPLSEAFLRGYIGGLPKNF